MGSATGPKAREKGPATRAPSRVIIEAVHPEIDRGRFPIKRVVGEDVLVSADIYAEGHDVLMAVIKHRAPGTPEWSEVPMAALVNDRWTGSFVVERQGRVEYTIEAWVDRFASWHKDLGKKAEAGQDVGSELLEGAELIQGAAARAQGPDSEWLRQRMKILTGAGDQAEKIRVALDPGLMATMNRHPDRTRGFVYDRTLEIVVERIRARFGAWYELFPRSTSPEPGKHGTFRTTEARLSYVAGMGFDVVYLPPIHPIGRAFRKGPNNTLTPGPDDPGSPWAIGGPEGDTKRSTRNSGPWRISIIWSRRPGL